MHKLMLLMVTILNPCVFSRLLHIFETPSFASSFFLTEVYSTIFKIMEGEYSTIMLYLMPYILYIAVPSCPAAVHIQ